MIKMITIPRYSIEALIKLLEINGKNSKLAAKTALENLLAASDNEETLQPDLQEFYNIIKTKRDNAQKDLHKDVVANKIEDVKVELIGQIAAYNDVLSLMESMFAGCIE